MASFYFYKLLKTWHRPVAELRITDAGATLLASEKAIAKIVDVALHKPALTSVRANGVLTKEIPTTVEGMIEARLKRNIVSPYFVSTTKPNDLSAKYTTSIDLEGLTP